MVHTLRLTGCFILALHLAACNYTPFGNDNHLTGHPAGTAIGAGIGAGIGYIAGEKSISYGLLGGLAGGAIGYYATTLRFASGGVIQAGGVVYTLGDYATVEIPTDNLFDANSHEFLYEAPPILDSAVAVLNRYPNNNILVSGNTSGFGTTKWEKKLSEARARQVALYLSAHGISNFKEHSIDTRKLAYVGYGNYFPIANNIKARSIRENSRIQITAYPSNADLRGDKKSAVFHNIAGLNEPSLKPNHRTPNIDNAFAGDQLPEQPSVHKNDFKDALNEETTTTTKYHPSNIKGEGWENQNKITNPFSTPKSTLPRKQYNYKGDGGFKNE
jgi:outer membrane protein OmpA-like peptidoglycan-associated protein